MESDIIIIRKHVISCRVNDDEFNDIVKVANQLNMKKSDILKLSLRSSLKEYRPINLTDKERHYMLKNRRLLLIKLGRLSSTASDLSRRWLLAGNNINQIAHSVNANKGVINPTLQNDISSLADRLANHKLISQNDFLIRRLTELWQSLE